MDASTHDRDPRPQQRKQSDSGITGTLEKPTAEPGLQRQESQESQGLEYGGWKVEGRGSGRGARVEGLGSRVEGEECLSVEQAVRQSQRSFFAQR